MTTGKSDGNHDYIPLDFEIFLWFKLEIKLTTESEGASHAKRPLEVVLDKHHDVYHTTYGTKLININEAI